jgi:hypothetical protein
MKMPKPSAAHKKLHKLAGNWSGEEVISPSPFDPEGGTAKGKIKNKVALDGFAVTQEYQQKRGGKNNFSGVGIFRFDAQANEYQLIWADSTGGAPDDFRGTFVKNVLALTARNPQGHFRCTFDLSKKDRYTFDMEVSPDGAQWFAFMSGKYKKKS